MPTTAATPPIHTSGTRRARDATRGTAAPSSAHHRASAARTPTGRAGERAATRAEAAAMTSSTVVVWASSQRASGLRGRRERDRVDEAVPADAVGFPVGATSRPAKSSSASNQATSSGVGDPAGPSGSVGVASSLGSCGSVTPPWGPRRPRPAGRWPSTAVGPARDPRCRSRRTVGSSVGCLPRRRRDRGSPGRARSL